MVGGVAWERLPIDPRARATARRRDPQRRPARPPRRPRAGRDLDRGGRPLLRIPRRRTPRQPDGADRHHRRCGRRGRGDSLPPRACSAATSWSTSISAAMRSPAGREPGLGSPLCDALDDRRRGPGSTPGIDGALALLGAGVRRRADDRRGPRSGRHAGRRRRVDRQLGASALRTPMRSSAPPGQQGPRLRCRWSAARGASAARPRSAAAAAPYARAARRAGACTSIVGAAAAELPLAAAVTGSERLEDARESLNALGVSTELEYERDRSAGSET